MSGSNILSTLSGVNVPNKILSLATYNQGSLPVYIFISDEAGKLYIYDISYTTQNSFSISGTPMNANTAFSGLAVSEQYLFANTPGNCYQVPLYQFYGTTSTVTNSLSAISVANCYTRDQTNIGKIAVTPEGDTLFLVTNVNQITKVSLSDTGNGGLKTVATIANVLGANLNGITLDTVNKKIYTSDTRARRIFTYYYGSGQTSNSVDYIFVQVPTQSIPFDIEYSTYTGTFAYPLNDLNNSSSLETYDIDLNFRFTLIDTSQSILSNSYAVTFDSVGGIYVSTSKPGSSSYTLIKNTYEYTPRPVPNVLPSKQIDVECGIILPGACKQVWQPFNPRERFSWGSPFRPYQDLTNVDIKISCPPSFIDPNACPGFREFPTINPSSAVISQQQVVRPPVSSASTQEISRSRSIGSTRISGLNIVHTLSFKYMNDIIAPPTIGPDGSLYITGLNQTVFRVLGYNTSSAVITSNTFPGLTFPTAPGISQTDGRLAFATGEGYLLVTDASLNIVWSIAERSTSKTPSYIGGNIFIANGTTLTSIAGSNGSVVWSAPELPPSDRYTTSTNVQLGNVFVGTEKGTLYAYDQFTGSNIFYVPISTGPILGCPTLAVDSCIYVGSGSNMFKINLDRSLSKGDSAFTDVFGNITSPVVVAVDLSFDVRAFFTTDTGNVYSVDTETYDYQIASGIDTNCIPVLDISSMYMVAGSSVNKYLWNMWVNPTTSTALSNQTSITLTDSNFVGSSVIINTANQLVGLTVETKNPVQYNWSNAGPAFVQYGKFMIDESNIYIGSGNNFVIRNTASGVDVSSNTLPDNDTVNTFSTVPLVIRGASNFYFSGQSRIYGRHNNIFVRTTSTFASPTSPVTDGTRIIFASTSNVYTAPFNLSSTNTLFTLPALVSADILVGSNGVFVPTRNGTLYFSPTNSPAQYVSVKLGDSPLSKPTYVYDTTYIVGSANCNVYWVRQFGTSLSILGSTLLNAPITKPITTNGGGASLAFVCTDSPVVYALNARNQTQEWSYNSGSILQCPAVFDDDSVYIATAYSIIILRAKDGTKRTSINTGTTTTEIQSILVDQVTKNVYTSFTKSFASIDPTIYAIVSMQ
jgi:PQQ-like domain